MVQRRENPYETSLQGNQLYCRKPGDTAWQPALFHDQVRKLLIAEAAGPNRNTYVHPRAQGTEPDDVTAFHSDQKDWGEARPFRPKILFQLDPPKDRKDPTYTVSNMMYKGYLLLDPDNRPIRDFREIPLTVSSHVEGWVMEAIRRQHSKISASDFRARMPRDPSGKGLRDIHGKWTGPGKDSLSQSGSVDMRMTRWRMKHRCAAWVERGGSKRLRDYFWEQLTPENQAANTTEWMSDVTDVAEMKLIESLNLGQYPNRSNKRKVGQQGKPQNAVLGPEEPGRIDYQKTEPRSAEHEEDPEGEEESATIFEDARQFNSGGGLSAPLYKRAIQRAPLPTAAESTNPLKRTFQASNLYEQSHGRLIDNTDSPRYAKRARQEGRMEPSENARLPFYDGTLPMTAQSTNPLKRKSQAANIYEQSHNELVEDADPLRYAKRARQEERIESLRNGRSDRRVEPGRGSGSRTSFMLRSGFQETNSNTNSGSPSQGPSTEVTRPSPNRSNINPCPRHVGVKQQLVDSEHTTMPTLGYDFRSAHFDFQDGDIPALGPTMYSSDMGYQHGGPAASGGVMNQPYKAYGNSSVVGVSHQPHIWNENGHSPSLGIGQSFMGFQHQNWPLSEDTAPVELGNQNHLGLGVGPPAAGMEYPAGDMGYPEVGKEQPPYMSYPNGDLEVLGGGLGQAQMGPQALQQDRTSTEILDQGESDYIANDGTADFDNTGKDGKRWRNGASAETIGGLGNEQNASAELNEIQEQQAFGGEEGTRRSAEDVNDVFGDIEEDLGGASILGSSEESWAESNTFAYDESDHGERMEAERWDQDVDGVDSFVDEAEDIPCGTEEETPALTEGGESLDTPIRPITPAQGHTKKSFTNAGKVHGEETGQNQDDNTEGAVEKGFFLENDTFHSSTNFSFDLEIPRMESPEPSSSPQNQVLYLASDYNNTDSVFEEQQESSDLDSLLGKPLENNDSNAVSEEPLGSGHTEEAPFDFLSVPPEQEFDGDALLEQDIDWTTREMVALMEEFLGS